jgi:hypothetical protein
MVASRNVWSIALVAIGALGMFIAAPTARAYPPAAPATKGTPSAGGTASASPYEAQIAALHETRTLLENANHDYKGHRGAAVKLIGTAIHALHPHSSGSTQAKGNAAKGTTGSAKTGTTQHTSNKPAVTEAQAASDAQLRQAATQLAAIHSQLAAASGTGPTTAAAAIQKAIQELQAALTVK